MQQLHVPANYSITCIEFWLDILRVAATMTAGTVPPSQILRKLASYLRQNDLASALREIGRVERTLFKLDWVLDVDMQRRDRWVKQRGITSCFEKCPPYWPPR